MMSEGSLPRTNPHRFYLCGKLGGSELKMVEAVSDLKDAHHHGLHCSVLLPPIYPSICACTHFKTAGRDLGFEPWLSTFGGLTLEAICPHLFPPL